MQWARLYWSGQNRKTGCHNSSYTENQGIRPDSLSGNGLCQKYVYVQFLHPGHVICRYGLPKKIGSQKRNANLPKAENRTTAFYQMGKMYAGNCR